MKNLLSIAGTDPTGGAGIQTDLKTFEAHGEYGMAVIAAVVAQNTFHVTGMQAMPAELVGKQIECVFEDIRPDAVKIGMLYDAEIIHEVAERLRAHHAKNIVLDPVMMSSSGQTLLRRDAAETLIRELFPLCTLVTPNLHEAAAICGHKIADRNGMEQAAREIADKTGGAVLVKGGHLADCADDLLFDGTECHWFPSPRINNPQHARHRLHAVLSHRLQPCRGTFAHGERPPRQALPHRLHRLWSFNLGHGSSLAAQGRLG